MKRSMLFMQVTISLFFISGCATIKDIPKGIAGISTRVLEESRKDALKKTFAISYDDCYSKVKLILGQGDFPAHIYAENAKKKMIAIYLSATDTTSVGIFFTQESQTNTLIEISSPSIYAKEETAKKIFTGLDELLNPKEKKADVKKESADKKLN